LNAVALQPVGVDRGGLVVTGEVGHAPLGQRLDAASNPVAGDPGAAQRCDPSTIGASPRRSWARCRAATAQVPI